jgi:Ca-activated chloride channel homolog
VWSELHLLRPEWLLALVPGLILLVLLWRRPAGAQVWRRVVDAHLLPHLLVGADRSVRPLSLWLLGLGWLLAALALAGPAWERIAQPVFGSGAARVLLLDLSPSMNAADLRPSRLARARFEILDLLTASDEGQSALLAFGPEPFVVSPLTLDAKTIASQVPQLTTDLIPVPGARDTARALRAAGELLERAAAPGGDIVLVTDGVGDMAAARLAAQALEAGGHRVSVLAVGTREGAPVPAGADGGASGFVTDSEGGVRIDRLPEVDLRELARLGNGRYVEAQAGDADTRALLAAAAPNARMTEEPSLLSDQWREEGPWLLLALLPFAALAFRRGWLVPVLACLLILPPSPGWAFQWPEQWSDLWWRPDQQAARHFSAGENAEAAERFRDPAWQAAASYRAGDYARALAALSNAPDPDADYNSGNALARLGRLDEAIAAYERALERDASHEDARHNLDLLKSIRDQQQESGREDGDGEAGEGEGGASGGESGGGEESASGQGQSSDGAEGSESPDGGDARGDSADGTSDPQAQADGEKDGTDAGAETSDAEGSEAASEPSSNQASDAASGQTSDTSPSNGSGSSGSMSPAGDPPAIGSDDIAETEELTLPDEDSRPSPAVAGAGSDAADEGQESPTSPSVETPSAEALERSQSMEAQLRRVPDDPGGLLRQRFLLQHLRREGRLP